MESLLSKVQYRHFEPGEFTGQERRNLDELIRLIEQFPWEPERDKLAVSLTNPSVTVEGRQADFLKLSLYYNGKFVLYYVNREDQLFTVSLFDLREAYPYLERFFLEPVFRTDNFKKEPTLFQHNQKHFVSKDFTYIVNRKSILRYLWSTSGLNFGFGVFLLFFFFWKGVAANSLTGQFAAGILLLFFGGGMNLVFFFNYYASVKSTVLIMSRGQDLFYFGPKGHLETFSKKDIKLYTVIQPKGSRSPAGEFAVVEIEFIDGRILTIPNLLINEQDLSQKLFACQRETRDTWAFT